MTRDAGALPTVGPSAGLELLPVSRWHRTIVVLVGIGCFIGANVLSILADYLAEFLPARVRGRSIAWACTVGFVGVPVAALLGGRLVAGALGALFIAVMRRELPESPRWLESRGRFAESERTVRAIADKVGAAQVIDRLPILIVLLCLDVGPLGPLTTGRALEEVH